MISFEQLIVNALKGNVRVNETLGTVEIFDDFGVKLVLRNLTPLELEAFKANYPIY